ncbi:ATP-binding protein [Azospirillum sp. B510]|uniref:ATP-binding protein n=2 Tax=Alphaproteobacteria TaxID=28211 RepID=UPI000315EC61|nr:YhaN family protein [Azospirillum sp. B510]
MRFAELHLERYGHFEDCRLPFQAGAPDFHMVYGPNEAGKSTTLSAVSDLLFGFPMRSPFNFRFDYALLRIGAVLEEDGRHLACRRRKSRDQSLIDATDRPLDEGQLSALLHGLNRETFSAGFSLDQAGLRNGGEAMLQASDDLGQALFAAGSGLTEISKVREALDNELDAIWGKRAAARRTFVAAERQLDACLKTMREAQLRPKEWSDAQAKVEACEQTLRDLLQRQNTLTAQRDDAERLRRIGTAMRSRAALLAEIAAEGAVTVFSPAEDTAARTLLAALTKAGEAHDAAKRHRDDMAEKLSRLQPDSIAALGEHIERLIEKRGGITKDVTDLDRLTVERQGLLERATSLRTELTLPGDLPSGLEVRKLRDIAKRHLSLADGLGARDGELENLRTDARTLREDLADAVVAEGLDELRAVIGLARGLGDDIDHRCAEAQADIERADAETQLALAALAPWQGGADRLAMLCEFDDGELQAASDAELKLATRLESDQAELRRLENEIEQLGTQRGLLAQTGQAVSADKVLRARQARDDLWTAIGTHLRQGRAAEAQALGDDFTAALQDADAIADRRYATAEESARLTALDHQQALLDLTRQQAEKAVQEAESALSAQTISWEDRLRAQGLPPLTPLRLRAWFAQRRAALDLHRQTAEARRQAARLMERRAEAVGILARALTVSPENDRLSPLLAAADRERMKGEILEQAFREKNAKLAALEESISRCERQDIQDRRALQAAVTDWTEASARLGIAADIAGIDHWLELVEELRGILDGISAHDRRLDIIGKDRKSFDAEVEALAADAQMDVQADPMRTLDALRERLAKARSVAQEVETLEAERKKHQADMDRAAIDRTIALDRLGSFMNRAEVAEVALLPPLLDRSKAHQERLARLAEAERQIVADGDALPLADLIAAWEACDPDMVASQSATLGQTLEALNKEVAEAANALGEARMVFQSLGQSSHGAADAAADAEAAKADMKAEADLYVLKRAQQLLLSRAVEQYRARRQAPLLTRAGTLFRTLTLGRFVDFRIDHDPSTPRLLGLRQDGETLVSIEGMSEGTRDQLFLALRLAAVEQSIAAGVRVPFIADDLFVNFDDDRAEAGLNVLAGLAASTQVLFFTHHAHLRNMGQAVDGLARLEL